uniref:Uncharacterized protein n=1 Tax=Tanacetum cinerariifolium TaxID=118510 RepID=A0A6L2LAE5_TANCI|nr:hypothetical protein [Tanacetum cinerariifolium]
MLSSSKFFISSINTLSVQVTWAKNGNGRRLSTSCSSGVEVSFSATQLGVPSRLNCLDTKMIVYIDVKTKTGHFPSYHRLSIPKGGINVNCTSASTLHKRSYVHMGFYRVSVAFTHTKCSSQHILGNTNSNVHRQKRHSSWYQQNEERRSRTCVRQAQADCRHQQLLMNHEAPTNCDTNSNVYYDKIIQVESPTILNHRNGASARTFTHEPAVNHRGRHCHASHMQPIHLQAPN